MRSIEKLSPSALSLLQSLPRSRTVALNGVVMNLYHGAPWDPLDGRVYPDFTDWDRFSDVPGDVILLGHTHYPFIKRYGEKLIVNPGSVGQPRDRSGKATYAILDPTTGAVQHCRVPFDPQPLIEDAQKHDAGLSYLVEVLTRR